LDTTKFIGEHLWPGHLGHFFAIISFVGALFSAYSYYRAVRVENSDIAGSRSWLLMGRNGFALHAAAVFSVFVALYYIIAHHLFEYHYAWEHSNLALPTKYLLSCFWEGQEGSFMLWTFWNCVLGLIVMRTSGVLETRTMAIIAFVQACLATMLLGIYVGPDIKMGSTPFILLRNSMQGAPIFSMANYMEFVKDGNGLNPLLQNYWMVIHPPILFLGFASTIVPFAYCIAALWKGEYTLWVKPTLIWSLFAGAVLGTGIMMGGRWAYESLNFGGYWAWDPVENASLVPWLTLVGAMHTLIVYKSTKRSLPITIFLLMTTYILVWYSTFLTRTGILGKTSVHAFTGDGKSLTYHLIVVMGLLLVLCVGLFVKRWKELPRVKEEEKTFTREFWMFIGSFILLLSSVQITITTSIPVWSPLAKWITGKDVAPPINPVQHYDNIQVWVAIITGLLSASVLYMRFKQTDLKVLGRRLGITASIALALSLFIGITQKIDVWQYSLMLFATCFGVVANIYYAAFVQKLNFKKLGPSIAHLGLAMVLLGILLSSFNKHVISLNTLGINIPNNKETAEERAKESAENVVLDRDIPVAMDDYYATYLGDSTSPTDPRTFYKVDYVRVDPKTNKIKERFRLYPDAFVNPKGTMGIISNPATKAYWNKDVFTYVTSVIDPGKRTDTNKFVSHLMHKGDTVFLNRSYLVFRSFNTNVHDERYVPQQGDIAVNAELQLYDLKGYVTTLHPIYYIRDRYEHQIDDTLLAKHLYVDFAKIFPEKNAAEIRIREADPNTDYIVLKAIVFPYINILWFGVLIMVFGFLVSMIRQITKKEKRPAILDIK
jgi:cytochrome c-type biogenesis protein CcmF